MEAQSNEELLARLAELEKYKSESEEGEVPTVFGVRLDQVGEIFDPYGIGNNRPFSFKDHPVGYRLRWCRESSRDQHGWKGWIPVEWEDEVGKNLSKYCWDAPRKLSNEVDSKVRRGDSMLCILPIGQWLARQLARTEKARANQKEHTTPEQNIVDEYKKGGVFGPGLTVSERPRAGFKMKPEEVSERSERAHGLLDTSEAGHNAVKDDGEE